MPERDVQLHPRPEAAVLHPVELGIQHVFHNDYTWKHATSAPAAFTCWCSSRSTTNTPVTASRSLPTYLRRPSQAESDARPLTLTRRTCRRLDPTTRAARFHQQHYRLSCRSATRFTTVWLLQLTRRFAHGLQLVGAYTWSHNIDDSTATHFLRRADAAPPTGLRKSADGPCTSALDRRQPASPGQPGV